SSWSTSGAPNCNTPNGTTSPGKKQLNVQANNGQASFLKLPDGNYMLTVWSQFSNGGQTFNAGADNIFNWGNGLRGCTDQIANSTDDLRLTVSGTSIKVYDISGTDLSSTYVNTSGPTPKILFPITTSADNADGVVSGTLSFPEANDSLVSITLSGQCT